MSRGVTLLGYLAIALCGVALEMVARRWGRTATLGQALTAALARRPFRVVLVAGWLWVGWHVFVRVEWR